MIWLITWTKTSCGLVAFVSACISKPSVTPCKLQKVSKCGLFTQSWKEHTMSSFPLSYTNAGLPSTAILADGIQLLSE